MRREDPELRECRICWRIPLAHTDGETACICIYRYVYGAYPGAYPSAGKGQERESDTSYMHVAIWGLLSPG